MTTDTPLKLLTCREVGARLGISAATASRLGMAGKIPRIKVTDKAVRFHPDDVEKYIEDRKGCAQ